MNQDIEVGDKVKLIGIPDWLIHDLPPDEQSEILACIGSVFTIERVDDYGYFWVGFGYTTEDKENAYYTGHSFCVTKEYLQPA
ncbi:MAG: hypothetical protein FWG81_10230 [Betaproteobacteria bacterium]|nr:hypothetical protein [Betaproteobacteria bacterium]